MLDHQHEVDAAAGFVPFLDGGVEVAENSYGDGGEDREGDAGKVRKVG